MDNKIIVAEISLHYESKDTILHEWTRERYSMVLLERKTNIRSSDWYYKRVTPSMAAKIKEDLFRTICRRNYDTAIMEKYNVGANYRENRWFMEQVRPTIF